MKVFCVAFLYLEFVFVFFGERELAKNCLLNVGEIDYWTETLCSSLNVKLLTIHAFI